MLVEFIVSTVIGYNLYKNTAWVVHILVLLYIVAVLDSLFIVKKDYIFINKCYLFFWYKTHAVINACSSANSCISKNIAQKHEIWLYHTSKEILMASLSLHASFLGFVCADLVHSGQTYPSTHLGVLKDVIFGQDF